MVKSIITLGFAALATVADATTVAVLELGKGGAVHRVEAATPTTSSQGVLSFWKSIHDIGSNGQTRKERATQNPGMSAVPDLFSRADGGLVIGVMGKVDLESMPTVSRIFNEDGAVAHFNLDQNQGRRLMKGVSAKPVNADEFKSTLDSKARALLASDKNTLESTLAIVEDSAMAGAVDTGLEEMLAGIAKIAESEGKTIIVHVVLEDDSSTVHRRLSEERDLEGDDQAQGDDGDDPYADIVSSYGYKSMFQIQYFNIVLWTALGLFTILFSANFMTIHMPLMPDTLLFGESAKMVAE